MNTRIEKEQPSPIKEISLGQDFHLLDSLIPVIANDLAGNELWESPIILNTDSERIPLTVSLNLRYIEYGRAIAPFNPDIGYQIDSRDFTLESRIRKIQDLGIDNLDSFIDFAKAPFNLIIGGGKRTLRESGLSRLSLRRFPQCEFYPEVLSLLKAMRLLLFFPGGSFEAKPDEDSLEDGQLSFEDFLPQDSPPLPIATDDDKWKRFLNKGFWLFVPSDPKKLSEIRARFVLADQEPVEKEG